MDFGWGEKEREKQNGNTRKKNQENTWMSGLGLGCTRYLTIEL
jgi:hypothetical protein